MSAGQLDITIEQGATFQLPLTFTNQCVDGVPGTPIDVSAWTFSGQVRSNYSSSIVVATFIFSAGLSTNVVIVSLTKSVTALIPINTAINPLLTSTQYIYDITATKADATVQRVLEGSAFISPAVTR